MESHSTLRKNDSSSSARDWKEALEIIEFGHPEESIEGMKVVCHELAQATSVPEGRSINNLLKDVDKLVSCLANKIAMTYDVILAGASSRSCKYVLDTIMKIFQNKRLAHAVGESTLEWLISELLLRLLDERLLLMVDGSFLLKALNVLTLKILDYADRTSSFVVLINLLRPFDPSRLPSPTPTKPFAAVSGKFSDLVVKCLIRLINVLRITKCDVDLDRILPSIHFFLQDNEHARLSRSGSASAGADGKSLLTVRIVLNELVKLRGTAIKDHLSFVPKDVEPQPSILVYIDYSLQRLDAARMLTASGAVGHTHRAIGVI